jgi:hypothetical protein
MTDDLVKRMRNIGEGDMYLAPHTTKVLIDTSADRIEALEAALREIEGIGKQYSVASGPAYAMRNVARAALGEEKDD